MLTRSLVSIMIIVCVFSFVSINNISYAGKGLTTWSNAETAVRNAERVMKTERDQYHSIRVDLKTLIDEWDEAKIANDNEKLLSVIAITGAIISVASGGSLYPAVYVAAVAKAKLEYNESKYNVQKSAYLTSMSNLLSLMDRARSNVNAAYNGGYLDKKPPGASVGPVVYLEHTPGYDPEYDAYLGMAVQHLNAYEWYVGTDYRNVKTLTIEYLEPAVKGGGLKGWKHKRVHDGDEHSGEDHVFEKFMTFADFVVKPDLPEKYPCKGDGREMFRTPYEAYYTHREKCGKEGTESISDMLLTLSIGDTSGSAWRTTRAILAKRSVADGCGDDWYSCDSDYATQTERHKVRTCKIKIPQSGGGTKTCGDSFRRCMEHKKDHDESTIWNRETVHSDSPNRSSTTTQQTIAPEPEPTPSPPAMHACNVHQAWQSGDHSAASCGTSGHYACDGSNHAAAGCGHASHYACDGLTHVQEQCTITNSNGDRCTYTFWRCLHPTVPSYGPSHTHTYPPPPLVACGAASWTNCAEMLSSSTDHQITCSNCSQSYWTCSTSGVAWHATPLTCQRSGCNVSLTKCQNTGGGGCFSNGTEYNYHDLP